MEKITFTDATLDTQAYVEIDGEQYDVVDSTYIGGTELNANTFNTMQSNIEDDLYYKSGDIYQITSNRDSIIYNGFVSGSSKVIRISIVLPKRLNKINSVTINTLTLAIRQNGNYVPESNHNFLNDGNTSAITTAMFDNILTITIIGTNAWTNAVNNTPIVVTPYGGIKLTFS